MAVAKSTDGGITWSDTILASQGTVATASQIDDQGKERGTVTFRDLDKPWITVGPDPENPRRGDYLPLLHGVRVHIHSPVC